jgi:hypothetical protein
LPARSGHAPGIGVAVLVPCLDEELTVAQVVRGFAEALPGAAVYVYDNASVDRTAEVARAAGAIVRHVPTPGKGTVVRRMFAEVDAEVYLLVDGDATYDPSVAPELVRLVREDGFDLVNVGREPLAEEAFRSGHRFGNRLLTGALRRLIGSELSDVLSGYKALSRRFVRSFPAMSSGFEIETEIAVHAATLALPAIEVTAPYRERPLGSESKLHTIGDGIRIAAEILSLARQDRPLAFFSVIWGLLCASSLALGVPVVIHYFHTHTVPRLPTALLAVGLAVLGFLSLACGLVLDTVSRGRREAKLLAYLALPPLHPLPLAPGSPPSSRERLSAPEPPGAASRRPGP